MTPFLRYFIDVILHCHKTQLNKLRGFSLQANYTEDTIYKINCLFSTSSNEQVCRNSETPVFNFEAVVQKSGAIPPLPPALMA
jgi:hypothetical protein